MYDEDFDADEILRDADSGDEIFTTDDVEVSSEDDEDEGIRELQFGTNFDENANFSDMASDLDTAEDLWE